MYMHALCSTFFTSMHTDKVLKWSRDTSVFFTIDKALKAAGGGLKFPKCPLQTFSAHQKSFAAHQHASTEWLKITSLNC